MKRYFAYIRPKEGSSVDQQRRLIERYAKRNRLHIGKWFLEVNWTATNPWPVLRRMLRDLKAGKASGVITDKLERFARDLSQWAKALELASGGVDFRFASDRPQRKKKHHRWINFVPEWAPLE